MGFGIWYPMCIPGVSDKHFLPPANEVWGKVIFSVACVKNSVHGGGLPQCMLGYHTPYGTRHPPRPDIPLPSGPGSTPDQAPPRADTPPGPGTPRDQAPLPAQCILGDTVNKRAVCILLDCNLV